MDCVFIEGLAVEAVIGVLDWGRTVEQRLLVDLDLGWDNRRPAASGALEDALDYAAVAEAARHCPAGRPVPSAGDGGGRAGLGAE